MFSTASVFPVRSVLFLCTIFIAIPFQAFPFRPFITDDAGIVPSSTFELESAIDCWKDKSTLALCLKHGITDRMDIGVAFGRCFLPLHERGYDPAELLLKFNFIRDRLSASMSGNFGDPCYSALLIFSYPLEMFSFHSNLGYSAVGAGTRGDPVFGLAAVAELGKFVFGVEAGGARDRFDWWQTGARFSFTGWLAADAGLAGKFRNPIDFNATTGLFFAFPL